MADDAATPLPVSAGEDMVGWRDRLHRFRPRALDDLRTGYDARRFAGDCFAGVAVGVVALPLALAFAIASGVKPEQGLVTAIVAGFLISVLGGSSVQIGGPAGAFIVVVYGIVQRHGVEGLMIATVLAGVLLVALGFLKLGVLVRYVPVSIVIGFTNGIAVLIALSQLKDLLGLQTGPVAADFFAQASALWRHASGFDGTSLGLGLATFAGLLVWARLAAQPSRARLVRTVLRATPLVGQANRALAIAARIPGPIVAMVTMSALAAWMQWPVETIGSRFGGIPRALPAPVLPSLDWGDVQRLFVPAVTLALLGAVESLLCARVADNLAGGRRHDPDQELVAQGVANIVTPFFGGMPATGTIARTMTNVRAGATSPVAGMVHALTLLVIVLAAAPLAASVPLPVLAGILLFVAFNMGEWHEFVRLRTLPMEHRAKLLGTFFLTVLVDLTVAMEVGMAVACGVFVWRMAQAFRADPLPAAERDALPPGIAVFVLRGALFFGAAARLEALADRLPAGTRILVLDAQDVLQLDATGIAALQNLQAVLERAEVRLVLAGLAGAPYETLARADGVTALGPANVHPSRAAALASLAALA